MLVLQVFLGAQGVGRLPLKAYGMEQGLMSEVVWCLVEDARGVLWAGTDVGLHRFDGQAFHLYRGPLPSQKISLLKPTPDGGMLVGTLGGLAWVKDARCQVLGADCGLPLAPVVDAGQERSGAWWVLIQDRLFREVAPLRFVPAPGWPGSTHPVALCPAWAGGELRVALDRALGSWDPVTASWSWSPVEGLPLGDSIQGMAVDGTGQTWLHTGTGLLRRPVGGSAWLKPPVPDDLATRKALGIMADRTGWLWVDTPRGLVRFRGEVREDPPWDLPQASGVLIDREGSTWIRGARGIHRVLGQGLLHTYGIEEGLPSPLVFMSLRDGRGRLWLGTRGGLCLATERGWRVVRPGGVLWLARGTAGELWFAGVPGGLVGRVDPDTLTIREYRVTGQPSSPNARGIAMDGLGRVWLADKSHGLALGTPGAGGGLRWQRLTSGGAPQGAISSLVVDPAGRVIVLHGERVSIHGDGRWSDLPDVLPAGPYQALTLPGGDLLVSYRRSEKLSRHRLVDSVWQRVGWVEPFRGVSHFMVYAMGADAQGNLWLGTNRGLVRHALVTGVSDHFGPLEGLPSADCVTGALLVEPSGKLWLGTVAGLVHLQAASGPPAGGPPAPLLLEVRQEPLGELLPLGDLVLARRRATTFRFVVPSYLHPTRLGYQVRMEGVDEDWRPLLSPVAEYGALPGGQHRLEIRGVRGSEQVGPSLVVPLRVSLVWHETLWGRGLMVLGAGGVLGCLYLWRVGTLRHRNAVLECLVAERTRELREAKTSAERASAYKSLFLATTTHDLRTPLHAILGYSRLAAEGPPGPETLRQARQIHGAAQAMLQLVNDLLDLGRIEAGQLDLQPQPFDLRRLADEVGDLLAERARETGLQLRVTVEEGLPPCLWADPHRVRQILLNLLGNAVKFTLQGQVTLRICSTEEQVRIEVEDTGPGIAPEVLPRLFQAYQQGGTADHQGSGLGLSITQQLARLMGGEVGAVSRPGEGSTFWCTFPLVAAVGPCPGPEAAGAPTVGQLRGRVLLADDNPANRQLARSCLLQLGVEPVLVGSGPEALEALDRGAFDVVIVDGRMPGMSGAETLEAIRRRPEGGALPVLLFTASLGMEGESSALPFDGMLLKPADLRDFHRILASFLQVGEGTGAVTHLDLERVRQLRGVLGDQEALQDFVSAFREDTQRRLNRMQELLESGPLEALAGVAHDLKTNAGNLGLIFLARAAMALEQEARGRDRLRLEPLHRRLEEGVAEAFRLLDEGWMDRA